MTQHKEESRPRRSYNQYCGLAVGLDAVGGRWSLLIVRELLIGPCRFGALQKALPGVGPNLLAERLKELGALGIVERHLEVPGGRRELYGLTELGEGLRQPVMELAKWGLGLVQEVPGPHQVVRGQWAMLAVEALASGVDVGSEVNETYQFQVDSEFFHLVVSGGRASVEAGPADQYDLSVRADAVTFVQIGARRVNPFEAIADGRVAITGELPAALRCCALLGVPLPQQAAAA